MLLQPTQPEARVRALGFDEMIIADTWLLARTGGEVTQMPFLAAVEDLVRNVHRIVKTAGLDGDELGYPFGAVAKLRRVE